MPVLPNTHSHTYIHGRFCVKWLRLVQLTCARCHCVVLYSSVALSLLTNKTENGTMLHYSNVYVQNNGVGVYLFLTFFCLSLINLNVSLLVLPHCMFNAHVHVHYYTIGADECPICHFRKSSIRSQWFACMCLPNNRKK